MNMLKFFGDVELTFEQLRNGVASYTGNLDGQEIRVTYNVSDYKARDLYIDSKTSIFGILYTTKEEFDDFWSDFEEDYSGEKFEDFWIQVEVI